jgi:hypothetical protein
MTQLGTQSAVRPTSGVRAAVEIGSAAISNPPFSLYGRALRTGRVAASARPVKDTPVATRGVHETSRQTGRFIGTTPGRSVYDKTGPCLSPLPCAQAQPVGSVQISQKYPSSDGREDLHFECLGCRPGGVNDTRPV